MTIHGCVTKTSSPIRVRPPFTTTDVLPAREVWLWQNRTALAMVMDGLKESARGEASDRSFAQHVDIDVDD